MIRENLRKIYNWKNRIRLMNKQFTLISSNCIGGCICHDLNQQFRSPFVNICLDPKDFLKYCENMKYFNSCELTFVEPDENNHPVALLGGR